MSLTKKKCNTCKTAIINKHFAMCFDCFDKKKEEVGIYKLLKFCHQCGKNEHNIRFEMCGTCLERKYKITYKTKSEKPKIQFKRCELCKKPKIKSSSINKLCYDCDLIADQIECYECEDQGCEECNSIRHCKGCNEEIKTSRWYCTKCRYNEEDDEIPLIEWEKTHKHFPTEEDEKCRCGNKKPLGKKYCYDCI